MDEYRKFISERIYQLRTLKNISARKLSLDLGLSNAYITKIENLKKIPSLDVLNAICNYFNITLFDFFSDTVKHPESNPFGDRIKSLRIHFNMTSSELSAISGVSESILNLLELGEKNLTLDTLLKLSNAFNINVAELIGQRPSDPITAKLKNLVEAAKHLSDEDIDLMIKLIERLK